MCRISRQHNFAAKVRPLLQQIAIIDPPLPRPGLHVSNHRANSRFPPFIFTFKLLSRRTTCPTLLQIAQLGLGLRDESNDVERLITRDGKDEEVFVLCEPTYCVGWIRPLLTDGR